jgi:hypothetical protein
MININSIRGRKSDFRVNEWILDSGAFSEISQHGHWRTEPETYADEVNRWSRCGKLSAAPVRLRSLPLELLALVEWSRSPVALQATDSGE